MSGISQLDHQTSFQDVIGATQVLLNQIDAQTIQADVITADIAHLLKLDKGPRGFFASLLTDPRPIGRSPS